MDDIKAGVYRHYKGRLYLVLGLAHDANADSLCDYQETMARVYRHNRGDKDGPEKPTPLNERTCVVYVGLQLDDEHTGPRLAVRTVEDFFAVVYDDGRLCQHVGRSSTWCGDAKARVQPRFTYIGPTWEGTHG